MKPHSFNLLGGIFPATLCPMKTFINTKGFPVKRINSFVIQRISEFGTNKIHVFPPDIFTLRDIFFVIKSQRRPEKEDNECSLLTYLTVMISTHKTGVFFLSLNHKLAFSVCFYALILR